MAKTILNLKLSYKGKLLDTIWQGTDFINHWYVGSNKYIFWQILDGSNKFPSKLKFLVKHGNDYYLQIPEGSSISSSKDGKSVDAAFLQQNQILKGTSLQLRNDMSGKVQLNPDYDIQYGFAEPRVAILGAKEQAVVADVTHIPPLSSTERTNRGLILLFLILGIAFSFIYDLVLKPRVLAEKSLSEVLADLERVRRIEPQLADIQQQPSNAQNLQASENTKEQNQANTAKQNGNKTTKTSNKPGTANLSKSETQQATFGSHRAGTNQNSSASAVKATYLSGFATATPGAKPGPGSNGTGNGTYSFNPTAGTGYSGSFDPNATSGYNQTELNSPVSGRPPVGGTSIKPNVPISTITDGSSPIQPVTDYNNPTVANPETEIVISSITKPSDATIPESGNPGSSIVSTPIYNNINAQLQGRKNQIELSYKKNSAIKASSGSITVTMYIDRDGSVKADVKPSSPAFSQSFLQDVKTIVENWRFNVTQKTTYKFNIRLSQG